MGRISPEIVENIRLSTDIVQLVGEYVRLQKKGKNYVGSCPFHQERDPSFTVTPAKQIFYCFGCHAGGNVFKFLMLAENLTFQESVRRLAERAGIHVPAGESFRDRERAAREEWAWKANGLARDFFHYFLVNRPEGSAAREYLAGRGLSEEIIARFKIGYAPAGWDTLAGFMRGRGYQHPELDALGLAIVDERDKVRDRFRHRVIFPVTDPGGRVLGFGGRTLGQAQPKYLNTPETPFFSKGKLLFGLDQARNTIRQKNEAVIMEGYLDVVTAHQYGITNAVASLGTSLTREQGILLLRYATRGVFAYDADAAGVAATIRGLDILQELGFKLKVITVPDSKDPDEFLHKHGAAGWEELLAGAEPLLEYKMRHILRDYPDKVEALRQIMTNLASVSGRVELEQAIKMVASRLNFTWDAIREELEQFKEKSRKNWPKPDKIAKNKHNIINSEKPIGAGQKAEQGLLQLVLEAPERLDAVLKALGEDFWEVAAHRQIFELIRESRARGGFEPARALDELDEPAASLMSRLLFEKIPGDDPLKIMNDYIEAIKRNLTVKKRIRLLQELAEAEKANDRGRMSLIMSEIQRLR